jgi:hypothetical protein
MMIWMFNFRLNNQRTLKNNEVIPHRAAALVKAIIQTLVKPIT